MWIWKWKEWWHGNMNLKMNIFQHPVKWRRGFVTMVLHWYQSWHTSRSFTFFLFWKTKVLFILPLPLIEFLCFILTRWESNFTLLLCVYFLAIFYLCAISFKRISEVLIIRCCCCCILINDGAVNGSIAEIWENARIYQLGAH